MKTIYDLDYCECRWPVNGHYSEDDEQLFCAAGTAEGLSYCPAHGRMSTADGSDPTARAPQSEPEFPRAHRLYGSEWASPVDREPDLVEVIERIEAPLSQNQEAVKYYARVNSRRYRENIA